MLDGPHEAEGRPRADAARALLVPLGRRSGRGSRACSCCCSSSTMASGNLFDVGHGWGAGAIVMILVTFLAFVVYDALFKSPLGKDLRTARRGRLRRSSPSSCSPSSTSAASATAATSSTPARCSAPSWRSTSGCASGRRSRRSSPPSSRRQPPDAALVALAGARSRHNTYLSVPLVWTMINSHTSVPFANSPLDPLLMISSAGAAVYWLYGRSGTVKGF